MCLSASSTPPYWGALPQGNVILATVAVAEQEVTVDDQFGNPLGAEYNGASVYEQSGGQFKDINRQLQSGSYAGPLGFFKTSNINGVPANSPQAMAWLNAQQLPLQSPQSYTQNIPVQIAGFSLSPGVVNRTITYRAGVISVNWP